MKDLKAFINKDVIKRMRHNERVRPGVMLEDNDLVLMVIEDDLGEDDTTARYGIFVETIKPENNYISFFDYDLDYAVIKETFKCHNDSGYTYYIVKIYRPKDGEPHMEPTLKDRTLLGKPEKDSRYELVYENKELIRKFKL